MTVLKEEIYISLAHWLREIGCDVSLERGIIDPSRFNIVVGFPYINLDVANQLAKSKPGYAVFDVEVLDDGMINYKPETRHWFQAPFDLLFRRAKAFFTYFEQSARFIGERYDLPVFKFSPAFCPALATHAPSKDDERDIDVLFFGRIYDIRATALKELGKICNLRLLDVGDLTTFHFRNDLAVRSKIVLHLGHRAPFQHIGMMRLLSMAHIRAFSLSEKQAQIEPELRCLSAWWDVREMSLVEAVTYWLERPEERQTQALRSANTLRTSDSQAGLLAFWETHCAT